MLLDTNNPSKHEALDRLKSGKILILQENHATALLIQKAFHAELVTPGSAVGGSFDHEITGFHSIGDVSFRIPDNPQAVQQAIQHRQADIDQMLLLCKERDSLERTHAILEMLCQKFGVDQAKEIPPNFLVHLTGTTPQVIEQTWNKLLGLTVTDDTASELAEYVSAEIAIPNEILPRRRGIFGDRRLVLGLMGLALAGIGLLTYTLLNTIARKPAPDVSTATTASEVESISALGYIEPQGEVVLLSAPAFLEGTRVEKLLVRQGDAIKKGEMVAILDNRDRLESILEQSQRSVNIAEAKLQQVRAGSKSGDILAQEAKYRSTKAELQGQVNSQQAAIANLQDQLAGERSTQEALILQVKAELSNASVECTRYEALLQGGAVSASQRDTICLAQQTAQERLTQATTSLDRIINTRQQQIREANANLKRTVDTLENEITATAGSRDAVAEVRPVDVQLATQELLSAKAAVKKAQADLAQAFVRSPLDGQILKINSWPGELVNQQKGIAELGRTEQMFVSADVYETDIARVRKGQKAIVRADRVVGTLTGVVEQVGLRIGTPNTLGTDPVKDADVRVVEVKIKLNPEDSLKVKSLTNLQVNVVINTSA